MSAPDGVIFMCVGAIVSALELMNDRKKTKWAVLTVSVLDMLTIPRVSVVQS